MQIGCTGKLYAWMAALARSEGALLFEGWRLFFSSASGRCENVVSFFCGMVDDRAKRRAGGWLQINGKGSKYIQCV